MHPYSQQACELKLGLQAGIVSRDEIIAWADKIIMDYDYDDDVANIALATKARGLDFLHLLERVINDADEIAAARRTMGKMYDALHREPERARQFTRFLEYFWTQRGYNVPKDMEFIWGIDDEFSLAEQGIYGTVAEATRSLLENLARYNDNTEQIAVADRHQHHSFTPTTPQSPGG